MSDDDVASRVSGTFLAYLKSVPEVGSVFFRNGPNPGNFPTNTAGIRPWNAAWVKSISVALVCSASAKLVVRNFNKLIDRNRVNGFLDRELAPMSGEAIAAGNAVYDSLFAAHAVSKQRNAFQNYLVDRPAHWGDELARTVTNPTYRNQIDIKYNVAVIEDRVRLGARLRLIVYLAGRLNPGVSGRVEQTFRDWYPQAFSEAVPGRLIRGDYNDGTFFNEVSERASVRRHIPHRHMPTFGRHPSIPPTEYRWGEDFVGFIDREAGPFRTGEKANDWEIATIFSCFRAGTPVHLADGGTKPIETVVEGDRILAADGEVAVRASEDSIHTLEVEQAIFGFNDISPFFSAAHTFLTSSGLKAIDPESARVFNPDLEIGRLDVGDTVLRLASTQPFAIEAVTISQLNVGYLAAGEHLYALVLDGPQTYFAGGFGVSANYPVLSEARIADGILALSVPERAQLSALLQPVMPLLMTVLRGFAGPRLQEAFCAPDETHTAS